MSVNLHSTVHCIYEPFTAYCNALVEALFREIWLIKTLQIWHNDGFLSQWFVFKQRSESDWSLNAHQMSPSTITVFGWRKNCWFNSAVVSSEIIILIEYNQKPVLRKTFIHLATALYTWSLFLHIWILVTKPQFAFSSVSAHIGLCWRSSLKHALFCGFLTATLTKVCPFQPSCLYNITTRTLNTSSLSLSLFLFSLF